MIENLNNDHQIQFDNSFKKEEDENNLYDFDEQDLVPELLPNTARQLATGEDEASYYVFMSDEDIKNGGFIFLLFGKLISCLDV